MRVRSMTIVLAAWIAAIAASAGAQPAPQAASSSAVNPGQQSIDLGHSMQKVTEWKFHPGDDLRYAQPGFDDSSWQPMHVKGRANSHDPFFSADSFVPGWTARGFPKLTGYAWYRTHLKLKQGDTDLWLEMPPNFDDAYQVYANGQLIGEFGKFRPNGVTAYYSRARKFQLPAVGAGQDLVLALRFYMEPATPQWNFQAGGLHSAPVIGHARTITLAQLRNNDVILHTMLALLPIGVMLLLAGCFSLWVYFVDREERAYLWLTAAFLMDSVVMLGQFTGGLTYLLSYIPVELLRDVVGLALVPFFWLMFWACWFRLRRLKLVVRVACVLMLLEFCVFACLRDPLLGTVVPLGWAHTIGLISVALRVGFALLLAAVTVQGIRQEPSEGWIALPAILLFGVTQFYTDLSVLGVPVTYFPWGIHVDVDMIAAFALTLVVLGLVIRRFLRSQARQQEMVHEL